MMIVEAQLEINQAELIPGFVSKTQETDEKKAPISFVLFRATVRYHYISKN